MSLLKMTKFRVRKFCVGIVELQEAHIRHSMDVTTTSNQTWRADLKFMKEP